MSVCIILLCGEAFRVPWHPQTRISCTFVHFLHIHIHTNSHPHTHVHIYSHSYTHPHTQPTHTHSGCMAWLCTQAIRQNSAKTSQILSTSTGVCVLRAPCVLRVHVTPLLSYAIKCMSVCVCVPPSHNIHYTLLVTHYTKYTLYHNMHTTQTLHTHCTTIRIPSYSPHTHFIPRYFLNHPAKPTLS